MTSPPHDFAELAERLRRGDSSAIEEIWVRFGEELRRRARTRLRQYGISGHAESMDICNAVLADLVQQKQIEIRDASDLFRYVRRAIDNQVRDVFRELGRQRRDFRRLEDGPVEEHHLSSDDTSPSFGFFRQEVLARLRDQLAPEDQRIVELFLANHDWSEIGKTLGIAPDTARMRWRRALERVRREFGVRLDVL